MKKLLDIALTISLVIIALALSAGLCLYLFYQNPPVEYYNLPFPTTKPKYSAGETVYLTVDYCKSSTSDFDVSVSLVDGLLYSMPVQKFTGGHVGCAVIETNIIEIPHTMPTGTYYLLGKSTYKILFFLRTVDWYSMEFEIVP